jgi:putative peptidoglycan lipid II flippase
MAQHRPSPAERPSRRDDTSRIDGNAVNGDRIDTNNVNTNTNTNTNDASFGRSASVMFAGTLLSRLSGVVRNLLILQLGFTALSDAYGIANSTPNMVFELVAGGVLSAVLIPLFTALEAKNTRRARDGINAIVTLAGVALAVAVALVLVAAPAIMWFYFRKPAVHEQRELATLLLRMFAPQIAMYGFVTISTAALNARRRFGAPMFAPIFNNLTMIVVLIWALKILSRLTKNMATSDSFATLRAVRGDTSLKLLFGFGTTMGVVSMAVALIPAIHASGIRWSWHWEPRHPAVRELLRLSSWTIGYVVANQIALFYVNSLLTNSAEKGLQTAYNNAYTTFFLLPHGLFAVSIMTALQPGLARAFLDRKRALFRAELSKGIRTTLAIMIPSAVGYLVLSPSIADLVQSAIPRRFNAANAALLSDVLQAFVLGLPAFSVYLLLMNALKAMRNTKATFVINAGECFINVVLAFVLYRSGLGVQGVALAFAGAYLISVFIAGRYVHIQIKGIDARRIYDSGMRIGIAAGLMGLVTEGIRRFIAKLFLGKTALLELPRVLAHLLELGGATTVGLFVYVVVARRIGIRELDAVTRRLARRVSTS